MSLSNQLYIKQYKKIKYFIIKIELANWTLRTYIYSQNLLCFLTYL